MHDIKFIRENTDAFDAAMKRRGLEPKAEEILKADERRRTQLTELQELQAKRNDFAKQIGMAKKNGEDASALMEASKANNDAIAALEAGVSGGGELQALLESLPNIPASDVPDGKSEDDNVEVRKWGTPTSFSFTPKLHDDIGTALGLMDFETAAKISGSRFVILSGALARMERALASFFLDENTKAGYTEVVPPFLVKSPAMHGTGQLPKFSDDLFMLKYWDLDTFQRAAKEIINSRNPLFRNIDNINDDITEITDQVLSDVLSGNISDTRWLIPTAEVPLTNMVADTMIEENSLPRRMTAYTPCFRSEAGAAGKDTRGMIRQHQFSKVEMVSITTPEQSEAEHERMTKQAESLLQKLGLPYRVMALCTGDMGFSAQKTYDIEVWMPGQDAYREISSCSNCGDFQARRMKARFKRGKETVFAHTLNGSGLPIGRTMVAIIENYQQEDGSIRVPEVLVPYMGGMEVIKA